jgi:hypothetical protein
MLTNGKVGHRTFFGFASCSDCHRRRRRSGTADTGDHTIAQDSSPGTPTSSQQCPHTMPTGIRPFSDPVRQELRPAGRYLVCSDGLSPVLGDRMIRDVLAPRPGPAAPNDRPRRGTAQARPAPPRSRTSGPACPGWPWRARSAIRQHEGSRFRLTAGTFSPQVNGDSQRPRSLRRHRITPLPR